LVIQALPELRTEHSDILYVVIGEGQDRQRLEQLTVELGVTSQVLFLGGIDDGALRRYYSACDIFVLLSKGDGFGIVYLEAMACGAFPVGLKGSCADEILAPLDQLCLVGRDTIAADIQSALDAAKQMSTGQIVDYVKTNYGRKYFRKRVLVSWKKHIDPRMPASRLR
jgi:phosphatidylinositol alpha-1,6-mannosyltransferase